MTFCIVIHLLKPCIKVIFSYSFSRDNKYYGNVDIQEYQQI